VPTILPPSIPPLLLYIFTFAIGTIVGSFLNVCIYRVPRKQSIVYPPSHCPVFNCSIEFYDNIPIVSYLVLKGHCRKCGSPFSPRYPVIEALTGFIFLATVLKFGFTANALIYLLLFSLLIVVTFIDIEHFIIPNVITYPAILLGLIISAVRTDWGAVGSLYHQFGLGFFDIIALSGLIPALNSLLGVVIGGGVLLLIGTIYSLIRKEDGMGMGDVKLLALIGAFLGAGSILFIVLVSSILGSIIGIYIIYHNREGMKFALPFGPFLSLAAVLYCFTGGLNLLH